MAELIDNRRKNALTKYFVAPFVKGADPETAEYVRLAKWIPVINNESEDVINESGYYDGDGTPNETVDGIKEKYTVEGMFDSKDPAQALIAAMKDQTGDGRKCFLKIENPDGSTEVGKATITNIKYRGGVATDHAPFNCMISRDEVPVKKAAPVDPETP